MRAQADMDEPQNALMGMHGYCTQELVNMIVTGECRAPVPTSCNGPVKRRARTCMHPSTSGTSLAGMVVTGECSWLLWL